MSISKRELERKMFDLIQDTTLSDVLGSYMKVFHLMAKHTENKYVRKEAGKLISKLGKIAKDIRDLESTVYGN